MKKTLIALTVLAVGATAASAMTMEQMDADGDGALTLAEIQSLHPEVTGEIFDMADTDANGMLDAEELLAAQELGLIPADLG